MSAFLAHLDFGPVLYGIVIFIGLYSMWYKMTHGYYMRLFIEIGIFVLVFKLHGGSMTGGFAATVAALLGGFFMGRKASK